MSMDTLWQLSRFQAQQMVDMDLIHANSFEYFIGEDVVHDVCIPTFVQTLLELKKRKSLSSFSDEEIGQPEDYIHIHIQKQPLRMDNPSALKVYKDGYNPSNESSALQFLYKKNAQNIPRYIAHDRYSMIIYPVCEQISDQFRELHAPPPFEYIHSMNVFH
ncbi:hypothetical protein Glove_624g24 [Diversispora epigaea]|uniref:DUF6826 domain-containing protein n=1 Tax=Diversispora epigaea TaxID=1348612 RepID=A0A397G8M1_9GLOM|nr:hypothetical protein Glove_624g24 [Diversispora epigaea]